MSANFKLYSLTEKAVTPIIQEASSPLMTEILKIPVYLSGLNTFSKTLLDFPAQFHNLWPRTFETSCREKDRITWKVDDQIGYSDHHALFIENRETIDSMWIATTIGPAYGEEALLDGIRLKLSAMIKVENVNGHVAIAIRFFQPGLGNVFDLSDYQVIVSENHLKETQDWCHIEVITSPLFPAPARVQILLRLSGTGKAWFDDVVLTRELDSNTSYKK